MPILTAGTTAPEFSLHVTPDQKLSLSELRGKPGVLAFYPADWSPVCGDELSVFNEILPELLKYKAELVAISVDGAWCHDAFAKHKHLHFPLLSDFEPKGETARAYGAYREADGVCERALFVLGHRQQQRLRDVEETVERDINDALPLFFAHARHRRVVVDPRAVHQDLRDAIRQHAMQRSFGAGDVCEIADPGFR
jgi:peroxiredoxin